VISYGDICSYFTVVPPLPDPEFDIDMSHMRHCSFIKRLLISIQNETRTRVSQFQALPMSTVPAEVQSTKSSPTCQDWICVLLEVTTASALPAAVIAIAPKLCTFAVEFAIAEGLFS
jgi:hypothetical protein